MQNKYVRFMECWPVKEEQLNRKKNKLIGIFDITQLINAMGIPNIREELHQLINQADEETVNRIYELIKSEHDQFPLTLEQQRDLEQRILRDERGESKSYTWEETLELIKQRK